MYILKKIFSCLIIAVLLSACGSNSNEPSPSGNTKDREAILAHWVDNIVIPSYENFQEVLDEMVEKKDAFTASPTETTLGALREAWTNAYREWQKVELFEFGPADKYTLRNFFNIYPADVTGIVSNMNDPSVNLGLPASYARQGFPALDYLINGLASDDGAIVAAYTSEADASKRMDYLGRIVSRMQDLSSSVLAEWKGPARDAFISKTGLDIGSSTGLVVNAYVLYYERYVRSGKIGIPSGAAIGSSGEPFPEKVEGYYKRDISKDLAMIAHQTAHHFFLGKNVTDGSNGPSFKSYLDALGAKDASTNTPLTSIINEQFNVVNARLETLSPDLHQQIETENEKMVETYAAMQKLVRLLKVDMTSAMSVTITYTDNDGD